MTEGTRPRRPLAISALLGAAVLAAPAAGDEPGDVRPVTGFELERYLGVWHEIAAIPTWFQEDCVAGTSATYAVADDVSGLSVLNSCLQADGSQSTVEGRARFTGQSDRGALEVTFVSLLGFWLWPLAGEYIVIDLDPDYQWSAVGHPSRDYGWILARGEALDRETLAAIAASFRETGYDTCRLIMSPRTAGDPRPPLCAAP